MLNKVGMLKDRFSRDAAHMVVEIINHHKTLNLCGPYSMLNAMHHKSGLPVLEGFVTMTYLPWLTPTPTFTLSEPRYCAGLKYDKYMPILYYLFPFSCS